VNLLFHRTHLFDSHGDEPMMSRHDEDAIARRRPDPAGSAEQPAGRDQAHARGNPRVGAHRALTEALAEVIASCERYATTYAAVRHAPIGGDIVHGPILLDILHGLAALGADADLDERVSEIISLHALDLEE
jgi:hypothetical protein